MPPDAPLLIIGAGPAGLSTALHLQQIDASWKDRLVLLDRAAHPRHKLCGGGVTQLGLRYLRDLGLPEPLPIPHVQVRDARFRYRGRTVHVRGDLEFVVFHRQEFDHYLAETARERGLPIAENERVIQIERSGAGVRVTTEKGDYDAQVVVGADGSRGVTRHALSRHRGSARGMTRHALSRPKRPARVARLLERIEPAAGDAPPFAGEYALFDFTPAQGELQGYVWDFPARIKGAPHHNRGIYDARIAHRRPRAGLLELLRQALEGLGAGPDEVPVEGHPIHWFSPLGTFSGERLLLVGDAAGAEPLFGEGIAPALGYGKIAAAAIHSAFSRGDFSFSDYKRRLLVSRLGAYLMLRWWAAWWSYRLSDRKWFMHLMWTAGKGLAALKAHRTPLHLK